MTKIMRKLIKRTEFYIAIIILLIAVFIQIQSGQFFTNNNILDFLRALIIPGMLGLGAYIVIVSGGIDISFPAVASLSMYLTTSILHNANYTGSVILPFVMSAVFGIILGFINGTIIAFFKLPTLIVTLGTSSAFVGFMHGILKAHEIANIPKPMLDFSKVQLLTAYNKELGIKGDLPAVFLIFIGLVALVWLIMRYTMLGRSIFALGGDENATTRIGFNVIATKIFIYVFVGFISGITGMTRTILMTSCHPNSLLGMELIVIAAVVLGGTRITGGFGSITGTILGTALFVMVYNSLELMGIPSFWQKVFTGLLVIIGTGISAYQVSRSRRKLLG